MKLFIIRTVKKQVKLILRDILYWLIQRNIVLFGNGFEIHHSHRAFIQRVPAACLYCALLDGKLLIRHYKVGVDLTENAQTRTLLASAEWIIEREHPWGKLAYGHTMLGAGIAL